MKSGLGSSITGRITGSNSVETLVRVGLEKEHQSSSSDHCKMIVLHDFSPCVDDELEVKRGQIVTVLYQENDWVYVIRDHTASSTLEDPQTSSTGSSSHASNEGFIPYSYCTPVSSQLADMVIKHKKIPRSDQTNSSCSNNNTALTSINSHMYANNNVMTGSTQHYQMMTNLLTGSSGKDLLLSGNSTDSQNHLNNNNNNIMFCNSDSDAGKDLDSYSGAASDIHPFFKNPSGDRYLVLYTFIARDENDVSVERGEFVTVLNMDDPDWFWILRSDGLEGFVPSTFLCALDPETNSGKDCMQYPLEILFSSLFSLLVGNTSGFARFPTLIISHLLIFSHKKKSGRECGMRDEISCSRCSSFSCRISAVFLTIEYSFFPFSPVGILFIRRLESNNS